MFPQQSSSFDFSHSIRIQLGAAKAQKSIEESKALKAGRMNGQQSALNYSMVLRICPSPFTPAGLFIQTHSAEQGPGCQILEQMSPTVNFSSLYDNNQGIICLL